MPIRSLHGTLGAEFIAEQLRKVHPGLLVHKYFVRPMGPKLLFESLDEPNTQGDLVKLEP